jgi:hypothetical protein
MAIAFASIPSFAALSSTLSARYEKGKPSPHGIMVTPSVSIP